MSASDISNWNHADAFCALHVLESHPHHKQWCPSFNIRSWGDTDSDFSIWNRIHFCHFYSKVTTLLFPVGPFSVTFICDFGPPTAKLMSFPRTRLRQMPDPNLVMSRQQTALGKWSWGRRQLQEMGPVSILPISERNSQIGQKGRVTGVALGKGFIGETPLTSAQVLSKHSAIEFKKKCRVLKSRTLVLMSHNLLNEGIAYVYRERVLVTRGIKPH